MAFISASSPHTYKAGTTANVMLTVIVAMVPGILVLSYFFGIGSLLNIGLALAFCLGFEAAFLRLRGKPVVFYLRDYSAAVTALLLAVALPPYSPWWLIAVACFFAIVVAKQLYGGLGFNPFNPAMVGYIVLLISFPLEMTQWAAPRTLLESGGSLPGLSEALSHVFAVTQMDGYTAATPLDVMKQNTGLALDELYQQQAVLQLGRWAGSAWEWVNVAFMLGGIYLLYKKVFTWHAPVSMLISLSLCAALFYDGGSSASSGSPLFHLFSGATMLGAFFIVTDPVSSAVSNRGRLIYGALIGVLIFVIRAWGNYPDAVAFAVLLLNFAAPFIDYYTKPRTYGHGVR